MVNGLLLFGVGAFVLVEAARRFSFPPDVPGTAVAVIAAGFVVNLISLRLLRSGTDESLNVRGARLEVRPA